MVRLSEQHGVNPTMGVCFWCGEPDGTIALLGRLPQDAEAHRYTCLSYEPCESCKEFMGKGVVFIEADSRPRDNGQPEIQEGVYPTGRWCVMRRSRAKEFLADAFGEEAAGKVMEMGKCYLEPEVYEWAGFADVPEGVDELAMKLAEEEEAKRP